ncbi:HSP20 family molecular chaperone IbpA [Tumebacillus sp. BK434]|uniref:Hsp20/alpha crystallin family protein n=1 Tax=Tumebacillus sp. BK434 TaxID=2512169 RepID=UPI0010D7513D|nr:Hsp20/alpha crystallin family protein [Tumebacillus sp. BK434]TCP53380.1 HSP20 family molecular chaperone IbpA [Tumebacillus sp. BK434]
MKDNRSWTRWEKQARQFFGDDFWTDILSVIPDAEQQNRSGEDLRSYERGNGTIGSADAPSSTAPSSKPAVDLFETEKQILVHVELPGLKDMSAVEVYTQHGHLIVEGTLERPYPDLHPVRAERFVGAFSLSIPIHKPIVEANIEAIYRHGLLEIRLPRRRKKNSAGRRINIQSEP